MIELTEILGARRWSDGSYLGDSYTYGNNLISQNQKGIVHYYGMDGRGNVRCLTSGGAVSDSYSYDAFGIMIDDWHSAPQDPTLNNYLYCAQQWDPDLGLYYLRARYLNPNSGRFWTMDSYEGNTEDPLSLHKYTYAQCDPVNNVDFSGFVSDGHHIIPQSLWDKFKFPGPVRQFFDDPTLGSVIPTPNGHNFTRHAVYNETVGEEIKIWLKEKGLQSSKLNVNQAKKLLAHVQKNPFVTGFNKAVPHGSLEVADWVIQRGGYKLLSVELQAQALKNGKSLIQRLGGTWRTVGSKVGKRSLGILSLGFTVFMAADMHAQGASQDEIAKAVENDLLYGIPQLAEDGVNIAWSDCEDFAGFARNGAFSYLDYDPESSEYDGGNGLTVSEMNVDMIMERQNSGVGEISAGSLIGFGQ